MRDFSFFPFVQRHNDNNKNSQPFARVHSIISVRKITWFSCCRTHIRQILSTCRNCRVSLDGVWRNDWIAAENFHRKGFREALKSTKTYWESEWRSGKKEENWVFQFSAFLGLNCRRVESVTSESNWIPQDDVERKQFKIDWLWLN